MGVLNKKEQVPLEIYLFVEYEVVCYDYLSFAAVCFIQVDLRLYRSKYRQLVGFKLFR